MDFDHSLDKISADALTDPIRIGGTAGIIVPKGTTAERSVADTVTDVNFDGTFRKNSTTGKVEFYNSDTAIWVALDDISNLKKSVNRWTEIDMANANYTATSEQMKNGLIGIVNTGDGTKTLTIPDGPDNPNIFFIFIYSTNGVNIKNSNNDWNYFLKPMQSMALYYAYSGPGSAAAPLDYGTAQDVSDIKTAVQGFLLIDMGYSNTYTMTQAESLNSMIVILNMGTTGTNTITLFDEDSNPSEYTFISCGDYDVNISMNGGTMTHIIKSGRQYKIAYGYGAGASIPLDYPASHTKLESNTLGTGDISAGMDLNEALWRVQDAITTLQGLALGALTQGVFIQQTDPGLATPYVWFKTDGLGNVIDILAGGI